MKSDCHAASAALPPDGVYCADGLAALEALPPASIDAIITDPPYNLLTGTHEWDYEVDHHRFLAAAARALKPTGALLFFGRGLMLARWTTDACDRHGFAFKEEFVWCKHQGTSFAPPISRNHELAVLLGRPRFAVRRVYVDALEARRYNPNALASMLKELKTYSRKPGFEEKWRRMIAYAEELRENDSPPTFNRMKEVFPTVHEKVTGFGTTVDKRNIKKLERDTRNMKTLAIGSKLPSVIYASKATERAFHPTAKPTLLLRWLVRAVAPPAATICDPFAGAGSTLLAALKERRHAFGYEINPTVHRLADARLRNQLQGTCICGSLAQRKTCPACAHAARLIYGDRKADIARFNAPAAMAANPPTDEPDGAPDDAFDDIPDETPDGSPPIAFQRRIQF